MDNTRKRNEIIANYKDLLEKGEVQIAYKTLLDYVWFLKSHFSKVLSEKFSFGNVSPGYMDFTYFPFFDTFLRSRKLRFGIVLSGIKVKVFRHN